MGNVNTFSLTCQSRSTSIASRCQNEDPNQESGTKSRRSRDTALCHRGQQQRIAPRTEYCSMKIQTLKLQKKLDLKKLLPKSVGKRVQNSQGIWNWKHCFSNILSESLTYFFTECFDVVFEGEMQKISSVVLEYVGPCPCDGDLPAGILKPYKYCVYCRKACTCSNYILPGFGEVCEICRYKGVSRCLRCR